MELVSPHLKPNSFYSPSNNCIYKSFNSSSCSSCKSKINRDRPVHTQVQIWHPTVNPKWKRTLVRPLKPKRSRSYRTKTVSTVSDVLCLVDSLQLPLTSDLYATLIKECTFKRDVIRAIELHSHLSKSGLRPGLPLLNRLLLMYLSCGHLDIAQHMFDKMTFKDSCSWTILIAGYVEKGLYSEAISLFIDMQHQTVTLSIWITVCILKACVYTVNIGLGKQVHGQSLKAGFVTDSFLCSSLINFYGKLGCNGDAKFVLEQLSHHDTVIWTAVIVNSGREEDFKAAIDAFKDMGKMGIRKNNFTFSSVLRACGRINDGGWCGLQVHANAIKLGIESDIYVQCSLVDMYGKHGVLRIAESIFRWMGDRRNAVCWNAMLNSYIRHGLCHESIKFLYQMKEAGVEPQESMLNDVRIVCGSKT